MRVCIGVGGIKVGVIAKLCHKVRLLFVMKRTCLMNVTCICFGPVYFYFFFQPFLGPVY